MNILPLGSVVSLRNAEVPAKLMIVARNGILTKNNITGYLDYVACFYPTGVSGSSLQYFNHEDIQEVLFVGYVDDLENKYQERYLENKIPYPKLKLNN
ncbi:hypothetical protein SAMN05660772_02847 [Pasteurella testudinis DSM 23072]|uniref:DUF4176 domain-containing protein n=1 Tax=Pasteurella testudinis DSM 23072 TaxID=1122938 RepID=A0A1W1V5E3_9PAST|nr:DUF4176 domain-containing protein [Pasteurella testudinis]SMB88659.1 hypothetical protein SAMN05660772_02847 [Pasteurella testudinis DSM 23072]SUB52158.1 Uncharacterized protein conserved in bacteria [Pasteurella testudinis]